MAESVSFVCTKCDQAIKPDEAREFISDPGDRVWQYDHVGECPIKRAHKYNYGSDYTGPVDAIRKHAKESYGKSE